MPVLALVATAGVASGAASASVTSTTALSKGQLGGPAGASVAVNVFSISGTAIGNRITVFTAPTGRLAFVSAEGIKPPSGSTQCTQDNPQQVSCDPGVVQVIVGDLAEGDDTFAASADLPVIIGGVLDGQRRPLSGGAGRDRITAGAADDLVDGGSAGDALVGNGGEDLLTGGSGPDRLTGGGSRDALFGGGGNDKLLGGAARDLCSGGPGHRDSSGACEIVRSVP
jgi:hypothetical protein